MQREALTDVMAAVGLPEQGLTTEERRQVRDAFAAGASPWDLRRDWQS